MFQNNHHHLSVLNVRDLVTYPGLAGATVKCHQQIAGSPIGGSPLNGKGDGFPKLGGQAEKQTRGGPTSATPIARAHMASFIASVAPRTEGGSQGGSEEGDQEHAWRGNANGVGSGGSRFSVVGATGAASGKRRRPSAGPGQR